MVLESWKVLKWAISSHIVKFFHDIIFSNHYVIITIIISVIVLVVITIIVVSARVKIQGSFKHLSKEASIPGVEKCFYKGPGGNKHPGIIK